MKYFKSQCIFKMEILPYEEVRSSSVIPLFIIKKARYHGNQMVWVLRLF